MAKVKTTYELGHDDVMKIVCDYFKDQYGLDVEPKELSLDVREYRFNEGYSGYGPDQSARINSIRLTR